MQVLDAGSYYWDQGRKVLFGAAGEIGLLDGTGGRLPAGAAPVYLEIENGRLRSGAAVNTAGQQFEGDREEEPVPDLEIVHRFRE